MKARCRFLCDHSVGMALSAIEIYNKPDFKEREQVFSILMVGAWESLLKAKVLKDSRNRMESLWVKDDNGRYKRNRSGQRLTIGLVEALRRCAVPDVVAQNVTALMGVRDAATHLTASSPSLPSLVYALGTAALRNYARLIRDWFDVGLSDYNFFILPVGFSYPFKTLSLAEVEKEPEEIARLLTLVSETQEAGRAVDGEFQLVCEISTTFVSAKKVTERTDFVARVEAAGEGVGDAVVVHRRVRPIDQYPLTFGDLWARVKAEVPEVKQTEVFRVIKERNVKANPAYAVYNFASKAAERRGPRASTPLVYNDDAAAFVISELRKPGAE